MPGPARERRPRAGPRAAPASDRNDVRPLREPADPNQHGRAWHLAFSSDSLSALLAAVRAGFGISAQSASLVGGVVAVPDSAGLPVLPLVDVVVLGRFRRLDGPVAALAEAISGDPELSRQQTATP